MSNFPKYKVEWLSDQAYGIVKETRYDSVYKALEHYTALTNQGVHATLSTGEEDNHD